MAGHCSTCGAGLVGRQRKFCSRRCKNRDTNHRHQNYMAQGARGVARKLRFIWSRGGRCQRCGYGTNYAALVAEIAKCQLLRQNCHMEAHHPSAVID